MACTHASGSAAPTYPKGRLLGQQKLASPRGQLLRSFPEKYKSHAPYHVIHLDGHHLPIHPDCAPSGRLLCAHERIRLTKRVPDMASDWGEEGGYAAFCYVCRTFVMGKNYRFVV